MILEAKQVRTRRVEVNTKWIERTKDLKGYLSLATHLSTPNGNGYSELKPNK